MGNQNLPVSLQDQRIKDKCAVFAISGSVNAGQDTVLALQKLQHRGQDSSGIVSGDRRGFYEVKGMGLVRNVYDPKAIKSFKGDMAIGHNRYTTSLDVNLDHCQPVISYEPDFALAHNGNLPTVEKLVSFLTEKGIKTEGRNDSELMHLAIHYYLKQGTTLKEAVATAFPLFRGAFSLVMMTKKELAVVRDRFGIRPLAIGLRDDGALVFASETCSFDDRTKYLREVRPGEMVIVSDSKLNSIQIVPGVHKLDMFEIIYLASPESIMLGKRICDIRQELGRQLALEQGVASADIIVPVPNSGILAAGGYAKQMGQPLVMGLEKNPAMARTFITTESMRREVAEQKYLVNPELVAGKSVVVIDDSIVRSLTAEITTGLLKKAGASAVHFLAACAPIKYPHLYGININSFDELVAAGRTNEQIAEYIQADSVGYLSIEGMAKATGFSKDYFSYSCWDGVYFHDSDESRLVSSCPIFFGLPT